MSDLMDRDKVLDLMASTPWELLKLFGISREEFMAAALDKLIVELKKELGGTLGPLFPLDLKQASFISGGLTREALLKGEHIDGGNRCKSLTLDQALRARDKRTKNKEERKGAV